jgi:sulfoquinovosidase
MSFLVSFVIDIVGNYYTTYSPMPIWLSNQKVGYFVDSFAYLSWVNNRIRVWDKQFTVKVISRSSYKEIVKQISVYNGYSPAVPDWVNQGAIVGLQGGTQVVMQKYHTLVSYGTKISGLWLQDWSGKRLCKTGGQRLWWNW